jgi:hypothetical protein
MRFTLLASATALFLSAAACSNTPPTVTTGEGGAPGTGGSATGGSTGTGGSSTGGSTGTGGVSTGGSTGTGGSGTGGSTGTGGSGSGTGGSTGTGGVSTGGSTGTGGSSSGTGGSTGTGGASTGGSTGTGGVGGKGTGGVGGAGGAVDLSTVAASFDGQLLEFPCGASHSGYDCDNVGCTGGTVTHSMTYPIKGTTGAIYSVTFNVRGVVEAYAYVGGTRAAGTASVSQRATNGGLFCSGGAQEPSGSGNDYNTYELDVSPAVAGEANVYYLNSVISSENPHTSSATQHLTFDINYNATIKVTGGGTLTFKTYDSNCKEVQNCGPTQGNQCQAPRTVSLAGVTPAAPTSFTQPFQMPTGAYGQWVYFDVTSTTAL